MSKIILNSEQEQILKEFEAYRIRNNKTFEPIEKNIKKFLKHIENIPIDSLSIEDYKNFFYYLHEDERLGMGTYKSYRGNITSFLEFLIEKGYDISFMHLISKAFKEFTENIESKGTRKDRPLSFSQWLSLLKTLEIVEEYKLLFYIQIIYHYQLKNTEQMSHFSPQNYHTYYFLIPTENGLEKFFIPPFLKSIIEKGGMPKKNSKPGTVANHFTRINNFSKEKILIGDIYLTSLQNFIVCPNCLKRYENIPENWAVFDYGEPHKQFILCRKNCYEGVING